MTNKLNTHYNTRKKAKKAVNIPIALPSYKFGVEVIPCGPAAEGVTGSCTLVRTGNIQFLILTITKR